MPRDPLFYRVHAHIFLARAAESLIFNSDDVDAHRIVRAKSREIKAKNVDTVHIPRGLLSRMIHL